MIDRIKREPAVAIGVLAACILAVIQTLAGSGVIGTDVADTARRALDPSSGWALPIVVAIVTRFFVTPTAAPVVPKGTTVTVVTPPGEPNKTVTV